MTALGIVLFASVVFFLLYQYWSARRPYAFPFYGYIGAAILIAGEILMFAKVEPFATYFTATAWTGYILWADAAVFALREKSLLRTYPAEFTCIAIFSIPLWLIFEAYNLRLANWIYVGVPPNWFAQSFGYAWAFATIWPAIFETAALLRALQDNRDRRAVEPNGESKIVSMSPRSSSEPPLARSDLDRRIEMIAVEQQRRPRALIGKISIAVGVLMLIAPVLAPAHIRPYLFGAVWLGFVFLLEPINYRIGAESLWRDLERGCPQRLFALLVAGGICGILWEFWNYWAQARWVYVFPIFQGWKIFAMPLPGYFGFPAFALECFAMFAFLTHVMNRISSAGATRIIIRREALEW